MSSISKSEALIFLAAYQNQGTLVDYLSPWIGNWTFDFILFGLSDQLRLKILEAGFNEDELEDVVQVQADIKDGQFGFEKELLEEWANWIMSDNERKNIVKTELKEYFYWHGKLWWEIPGDENDNIPWFFEEGMPETPQEAFRWFSSVFSEVESN